MSLRSLSKSPGFTVTALVTLALGIGVNTAMFSVVDTVLFRSAPYPEPDRLVQLAGVTHTAEVRNFSEQEIREIRPQAQGFSSLTTLGHAFFALAEPGRPAERVHGIALSREMADTFRVQPVLGRSFTAEEFEPGKNQVVLLNESFWQARFGGDPSVIGRTLRLDGETVTIIGVIPARLDYKVLWGNVALWRPLNFTADQSTYRGYRSFLLIGRLKPGATAAAIAAQLAPLAATQEKTFPQDYPGLRYRAIPLHEAVVNQVSRSISWMLLGLSGFVLLIACANLANLQLARATASARDFAIRAALGASRGRIVGQQLVESVALSLAGGGLGFIVALWVNSFLENRFLIDGAPAFKISVNGPVFLATLLVSLFTGVLFGLAPALLASRADVSSALKAQSRCTASRGQHRLRHLLIVGEIAVALVLLGGAATMNRGFSQLLQRHNGWDTARILSGTLAMPEARFDTSGKRTEFYRRIESELSALPGVERVALSSSLPLFNYTSDRPVFTDAPSAGPAQNPLASHVLITPGYFATLGIPVIAGRIFAPDVKPDSPPHIVVNVSLAQRFWPGDSAIGKRLGVADNASGGNVIVWREVIGVVGDVEPVGNISNPTTRLTVYRPLVQEPWSFVNLAVRSANPAALIETIRRAVAAIDADLPADQLGTIRQFEERALRNILIINQILTGFALLGLGLAAIGLYGVISNIVAQRTAEFGLRLALGAAPRDLLGHVMVRGVRLAGLGLLLGLAGAYGLSRFLGTIMPRLANSDPAVLAGVAALLFAVALLACWVPARRATKVDPMTALRAE